LCPHCKKPVEDADLAQWQALVQPFKMKPPAVQYQHVGCDECRNTGYMGRLGIYEVMRMTAELRKLIRAEAGIEELRQQGFKQGMEPLRISGARKIHAGLTTVDEVLRVAPPTDL
jgi:general secretion pathway protein E